jgi:hypothetical protein
MVGDTLFISSLGHHPLCIYHGVEQMTAPLKIILKETAYSLDQIVITHNNHLASQIAKLDLNINPVNSAQEILQRVPGLVIGQHAGGGLARGENADNTK